MRGAAARSIANARWHPTQSDQWKTPGEVLARAVPFHNIREMAQRLAKLPGVSNIEPPELATEILAVAAEPPTRK